MNMNLPSVVTPLSIYHSAYRPTSWSHHHINLLVLGILSAPLHSVYMGRQDICAATVTCLRWIHSLIGHSPTVSRASTTGGHSHFPLSVRRAVIPAKLLATQWRNPSSTFSMAPVTTQLSIPYNNTDYTTDLYNIPLARTVAPVFVTTFPTIAHRRRNFQRLWYRAKQLLLL